MSFKLVKPLERPQVDLDGPQGNAYCLVGYAITLGGQLDWTTQKISIMQSEMTAKDYTHLVKTFIRYFGEWVDIVTTNPTLFEELGGEEIKRTKHIFYPESEVHRMFEDFSETQFIHPEK